MKPKHRGFSRVFGLSLSRNPDFAFKVPVKPLLFHIVRGQHMMPNVIRGRWNWYCLSSDVFKSLQFFRTAAESEHSSR